MFTHQHGKTKTCFILFCNFVIFSELLVSLYQGQGQCKLLGCITDSITHIESVAVYSKNEYFETYVCNKETSYCNFIVTFNTPRNKLKVTLTYRY